MYNISMNEEINIPNNTEIDKALKEFEAKQSAEQMQKAPETLKTSDIPKMVQLVIKASGGTIQEQKQAEYVLLGFVIVAIAISLFLVFGGSSSYNEKIITPMPAAGVGDPNFRP